MTTDIVKSKAEIILSSIEEFKKGPEVLRANEDRKNKALVVGNDILAKIQEHGMDDALDERANNYLANCTKASKEMKENRSSVTQIMDQLKKMYTEVENEIDPSKEGTVGHKIQQERNAYAQKKAREKAERERLAQLELQKKQERIDLKTACIGQLNTYFNDYIVSQKNHYQGLFNGFTLADIDERGQRMQNLRLQYREEHFNIFTPSLAARHHNADELKQITSEAIDNSFAGLAQKYSEQMDAFIAELVEKLPSKKAELLEAKRLADEAERQRIEQEEADKKRREEMAVADAKRKKELEEQAERDRIENEKRQADLKLQQEKAEADRKKREEEEAAEILRQQEEQKKKEAEALEIQKQGEQTMAMFEKEMAVADTADSGPVREGFEIVVKHPVGYTQIFAFWFERAGKDLAIDKIGNTKLDQMKAWCEKLAQKSGEKITSQLLEYKETFKAVNKKAKAE